MGWTARLPSLQLPVALEGSSRESFSPLAVRRRTILCLTLMVLTALCLSGMSATTYAQSARKGISKDAPPFPSDALDEGVSSGSVKVRLSVAADGSVTKVDILESNPKDIFDRAVKRTLIRWKYEPGAAETIDTLVSFKDH